MQKNISIDARRIIQVSAVSALGTCAKSVNSFTQHCRVQPAKHRNNRINQRNNNNVAAAINEKFKADVTRYAKPTEQDIAAQKQNMYIDTCSQILDYR